MNQLFYFVEGINNDLQSIAGWHERAERYIERNTIDHADNFNYHVSAWNRWIYQKKNVANCIECLQEAWNQERDSLIVTAHSNGCAIIASVLQQAPFIKIKRLYLIAAALDDDFKSNGLNDALEKEQVEQLTLCCSSSDSALKWARRSRDVFGWLGLGYGSMGLTGPTNVSQLAFPKLTVNWYDGFDHSTYFDDKNFEKTMEMVIGSGV